MSVTLNIEPSSPLCAIRGEQAELQYINNIILEHAAQLDGPEATSPGAIYGGALWVPTGWAIWLAQQEGAKAPDVEPWAARAADVLDAGEYLWPHQAQAVRACLTAPWRRGIVRLGTGAGKTRIAAAIIGAGHTMGIRQWVYLTKNQTLLEQAEQTFEEWVPRFGKATGCRYVEVHTSTFGSLNPSEFVGGVGVIVDECHAVATVTRLGLLGLSTEALFGMSATPLARCNGANSLVLGLFGPELVHIPAGELIKRGILCGVSVAQSYKK